MSPDATNLTALQEVSIYTDGGAAPNPGTGGFGVVLRFKQHVKELSGGYALTTNNRMELMAVIIGLEALKQRCKVRLYSDSKYIVDSITKGSAFKWRDNSWALRAAGSKLAKNPDLWERLLAAYEKHSVELFWVKGHAGVEDNERCDQLATAAMQQPYLPTDTGYAPDPPTTKDGPTSSASKTKMKEVGQPCQKCQTPVIQKPRKKKTFNRNQTYYFAWSLFCPSCKSRYTVEDAKRLVSGRGGKLDTC